LSGNTGKHNITPNRIATGQPNPSVPVVIRVGAAVTAASTNARDFKVELNRLTRFQTFGQRANCRRQLCPGHSVSAAGVGVGRPVEHEENPVVERDRVHML
jgi:hypothetical protein